MQRSLAVVALVVLVTGLGTIGYLQVAGEAGEPPPAPAPASSPTPTPSAKPEPIVAPTRAPRPEPSPSPTAEPTPTPNAAESRPPSSEPVPVEPPAGDAYTEDEYRAIYEDLQARSSQFATSPDFDPDHLARFFTTDCQCWEDYYGFLLEMHDEGEHTAGPPPVVLHFDLTDVSPDGGFRARVVDQQNERTQLVGADGNVIEEYPPSAPFESEVSLTPTPDGWRVTGLTFITQVGP